MSIRLCGEEIRVVVSLVKRFQRMHFFTRALLGFVALLIVWANVIPYYSDPNVVYAGYGWPFKFLELPTIVIGFPDGTIYPPKSHVFYTPEFVVNLLAAFAILGVFSVALERYVWTHTRPRAEAEAPAQHGGSETRSVEGTGPAPAVVSAQLAMPAEPAPNVAATSGDAPKT